MNTLDDLRASLARHADEIQLGEPGRHESLHARIRHARNRRRAVIAGAAALVVLAAGGLAGRLVPGQDSSLPPAGRTGTFKPYPAMYGSERLAREFVWDIRGVHRTRFTVRHGFPAVVRFDCRGVPKADRLWLAVDGRAFGGTNGCAGEWASDYTVHLGPGRHTLSASVLRRDVPVQVPQGVGLRIAVYDASDRVRVGGVSWDRVLVSDGRGWTAARVLRPGRITPSTDVMLGFVAHREARVKVVDAHGTDVGSAFVQGGGTSWGTVLRAGHSYRVSVQGSYGRAGSKTATIVLFEPAH